eukprot:5747833-Pyramimonas_sp.AAC.1
MAMCLASWERARTITLLLAMTRPRPWSALQASVSTTTMLRRSAHRLACARCDWSSARMRCRVV